MKAYFALNNSAAGWTGGGGGGGGTEARDGAGAVRATPLVEAGAGLGIIDCAAEIVVCPGSFWATGFGFDAGLDFCRASYNKKINE